MRIGVIGVGRIGTLHATNLAARAELVLTDANLEAATGLAGELGATVAADAGALLDSGLDGVVIASSTDTHPALLRAAMERDLPAFCEKPVAMTLAEATTLARLEADRGARVQIGFQRRWDLGYRRAQQAVHTGELGLIHTIRATTLDNNPPPATYIARSGGIFADMCVHDFDIVRFVSGREVVSAFAVGGNKGPAYIREAGDADTVAGILTLDDGTLVSFNGSRINRFGHDIRLEVHGETGDLAVGLDDSLTLTSAEPGVSFPHGSPIQGFIDRFADAYARELNGFLDLIEHGTPSVCSVADGLAAIRIAVACQESLTRGVVVELAGLT
ncbi:MAG: Gfo/Idh/MocA family oxidoreductase [Micropruina sp.]